MSLSSHIQSVTCLRWSGRNLIYSSSQDRTIKVWKAEDGSLCRTLDGHAHWVNTLALNSDYVIRTGAFDPKDATLVKLDLDHTSKYFGSIRKFFFSLNNYSTTKKIEAELKEMALKRYNKLFVNMIFFLSIIKEKILK